MAVTIPGASIAGFGRGTGSTGKTARSSGDEAARQAALSAHRILDTAPEAAFDRITRLAVLTLDMPVALISLTDRDRQWFKSRCGIDVSETPRAIAFCDHAIRGTDVMVIEDATRDPRFADNPLVTGPHNFRFYAGAPLIGAEGVALGTLCVLDSRPREFEPRQKIVLEELAAQVMHEISVRTDLGVLYNPTADLRLQLEALLAATGSAGITFDRAGKIRSWNGAAERMFGFDAEKAVGMSMDAIMPRLNQARRASAAVTGMASAWLCAQYPAESRELTVGRHRDGHLFPVEPTFAAWKTAAGKKRAGVILLDATHRHRQEEQLRRSRTHLIEAQRIGGIGSWDWNVETGEIDPSDAMCQLLDLPPGTRRNAAEALRVIHPEDRPRWLSTMNRLIAGEPSPAVTYRMLKPDGSVRTYQSTAKLVQYSDGPHLIGVLRDITEQARQEAERARHEEALRRSQIHLAEAQKIGGIGSWDWHVPTGEVTPSAEMRKLIGIGPEDARNIADARAAIHPDDRDAYQTAMERFAADGDQSPFTYRMSLPDGTLRVFQITGRPADYGDGSHVVGVIRDITEQTQRDSERRETEKLAALGQLAGGVAHEINNLLQPVITLSELACEDLAADFDAAATAEMRESLAIVTQCGRDAREIVRKILRYARKEMPTLEPTVITEALNNSMELVRGLLSPGVSLGITIDPGADGVARIN
jgi:PAS domain S-box-containing protein